MLYASAMLKVLEAAFAYGATDSSQVPAPTIGEIAFAGRSNVGKSTLMNALMHRKNLVRTSRTPGATRAINFFKVALEATLKTTGDLPTKHEAHFVDLPGYGFAKVSKEMSRSWGALLEGYLSMRPTLRAVVLLVDVRRGLEDDDRELLEYMQSARGASRGARVVQIVAATKMDKVAKAGQKIALEKVRAQAKLPCVGVSGETGEGTDALWRILLGALTTNRGEDNPPRA